MTDERVAQLRQVIANIQFEDKHRYNIAIMGTEYQPTLTVARNVICNVTGQPTNVYNLVKIHHEISDDQFVRFVFMLVGQYEAHEFAESFRYKGVHAYYPHDTKGKVSTLYGESNDINTTLLQPWRDLVDGKSFLKIGIGYILRWVDDTFMNIGDAIENAPMRFWNFLNERLP
jgi:hypothetical protein